MLLQFDGLMLPGWNLETKAAILAEVIAAVLVQDNKGQSEFGDSAMLVRCTYVVLLIYSWIIYIPIHIRGHEMEFYIWGLSLELWVPNGLSYINMRAGFKASTYTVR